MSSRMKKSVEGAQLDPNLAAQADNLPKGMIGVGLSGRPFMDYLLYNAYRAGYDEILLLLNPKDQVTKPHFDQLMAHNKAWGLQIHYATQHIPAEREKPLGTADAVLQAIQQHSPWQAARFAVCNSDNLYSSNALRLLNESPYRNALISYERDGLGFPEDRIKAFAILSTDAEGYLEGIIEKPSDEEVAAVVAKSGRAGVSMNIFIFTAEDIVPRLERIPLHPVRQEKELPGAVSMLANEVPQSVKCLPLSEEVPDLTSKTDISVVQGYLEAHFADM